MITGLGALPGIGTSAVETARSAAAGSAASGSSAAAGTFGNLLENTVSQLKGAEQVSMQALQGDADTRQVVDAVMNAQQSLQTAIAIRDKIVSAYLDISRMAI